MAPVLNSGDLSGGYQYSDAQTDDARLVLRVIREGVGKGGRGVGLALNYARVESLLKRRNGQVCGVAVSDVSGENAGRTIEVQAPVIVNATGAATDQIRAEIGGRPHLRCLRGSHLVFAGSRFPLSRAIIFAHPFDDRPVFAIPWEGVTLFGTTDVDHEPNPEIGPVISGSELDYLLSAVEYAFPELQIEQADVQATMSGVRAVIDTGKADPSKESREHLLWTENGLLSVAGGKLTNFRIMALDALRAVQSRWPSKPHFQDRCVFETPSDLLESTSLEHWQQMRLAGRYGKDAQDLLTAAEPGELKPVAENLGVRSLWVELRWAARAEGVVHLDDLLLRRVRLGLLLPQAGMPWMERIRSIVQPELGWDDIRWTKEVAAYADRWCMAYYLPEASGLDIVESA